MGMFDSLNRYTAIGRLTRDPEVKYTTSGKPVARFSLAVSRSYKDGNQQRVERTVYPEFKIFGPSAEFFARFAQKGTQVYAEGEFSESQWTDKDQNKRSQIEFLVGPTCHIQLLAKLRPKAGSDNPGPLAGEDPPGQNDDVPF